MSLKLLINNLIIKTAYAQDFNSYEDVPEMVDAVARAFNILLIISGSVFVAFIILAAYKFLTSQGDPKGIAGARQSLTYAFIGFFIILAVVAINTIVVNILGAPSGFEGGGAFSMLRNGIQALIEWTEDPLVQ